MVQAQELSLDELILQTFEEQEDAFSFPVRSQKDAKAFVRSLNLKGLPYQVICQEIGEFEHNFTSWRKSLGRIGIGQRVIERINRPLQSLLDEEELYYPFGDRSSSGNGIASRTSYTTTGHTDNHVTRDESSSNDDTPAHSEQENGNKAKTPSPPASPRKTSAATSHDTKIEQNENREKKGISEPEQRSTPVQLRHVEMRKKSEPRKASPESSDSDGDVKMSVAERISAYNSGSPSPTRKSRHSQERESKSESSEREFSPTHARRLSNTNTLVSRFESLSNQSSSSSMNDVSGVDERPLSPKLVAAAPSEPVPEPREPTPEPEKEEPAEPEPGLALSLSNGVQLHGTSCTDDDPDVSVEQSETNTADITMNGVIVEEDGPAETTETTPEENKTEDRKRILELRKGSLDARKDILERKKSPTDFRKGSLFDVNSVSLDEAVPCVVDENYNSDLDPENEDQSPVMAKLVQKISAMRSNTKNTAGFIYMFTDSTQGSEEIRVKVGASRCPDKRLQQAQLFNPDLTCLETIAVCQRLTVLSELNTALEEYACNSPSNWYQGPADELSQVLHSIAEKYPSKLKHRAGSESSC